MALREELRRSGNWLFRWRSYLPLFLIGVCLLGVRDYEYVFLSETWDDVWEIVCLIIAFIGLGIRIYTIGHVARGTSGRNTRKQKARVLNTTGMYSIVRHPLYLGNFFIWLGISMFVHLWWISLIFLLSFWVYYERIIFAEEEFLREKFSEQFEEWAANTQAFLPTFRNWKKPNLPFSVRTVLRREYSGFFGIIASFTFLEVVGDLVVAKRLELDPMWTIIFLSGLIIYLVLRALKKWTNLLSVEGR